MQYYTIRPVQKLLKDSAAPQISRAALAQTIRQVTKTKLMKEAAPEQKASAVVEQEYFNGIGDVG